MRWRRRRRRSRPLRRCDASEPLAGSATPSITAPVRAIWDAADVGAQDFFATSAPLGPMPGNKHPVLVAVTLVVAVLATIGFVYINSVIASRSVAFLLALDLASWSGLATGAGALALFSYFLYIINYPEGQSVSDAISQRGRNKKTL